MLQFLVDDWATYEQMDLDWCHKSQNKLQVELHNGQHDAIVASEKDVSTIEHRVVLPSLFPEVCTTSNSFTKIV
jgi:hypothetical protein